MFGKVAVVLGFWLLTHLTGCEASECGMVYNRATGDRIVGGHDAGEQLIYPWFAALRLNNPKNRFVCAGSLITPRHVLTAAHCFQVAPDWPKAEVFTVAMYVNDRCNESEPWEIYKVSKAVVHENYKYPAKTYDVAILFLNKPSQLPVVCMPEASSLDVFEPAVIMGYGVTREGDHEQPCLLQVAHIYRYTKDQCQETDLPKRTFKDDGVICAGALFTDSCQGDSGGPLLTFSSDGSYIVSGIVSYGFGCARENYPGLYTNVAYYVDWITDQLDGEPTKTGEEPNNSPKPPTRWQNKAVSDDSDSRKRQGGVWFAQQSASGSTSGKNMHAVEAMSIPINKDRTNAFSGDAESGGQGRIWFPTQSITGTASGITSGSTSGRTLHAGEALSPPINPSDFRIGSAGARDIFFPGSR